mmetsp:Transcript_19105/g.24785  ORF Transcript_19105/g.24785 Transcript_19105/m.24785 type:complete len:397 (+) Transcript_19105:99-1289(+)
MPRKASPEPKIHDVPNGSVSSSAASVAQKQWWSCLRRISKDCGLLVSQFRDGVSKLCIDVRIAWRHRKLSRLERRRRLGRKDLLVCQRALGDLLRVLPIMINPLPPPFGLSLIAIAYRWPRFMLPPQFHTIEQKQKFAQLDAARQTWAALELCQSSLFSHVLQALRDPALAFFFSKKIASQNTIPQNNLQQLSRLIASFTCEKKKSTNKTHNLHVSIISLEKLNRKELLRFVALAQPRLPVSACCDRFTLRAIVRRKAADIDDDDALLLANGSDPDSIFRTVYAMQKSDLIDACIARALGGINPDDSPGPQHRLAAWLQRRAIINLAWPNQSHLPPTFVFFLAVLHFDSFEHNPIASAPSTSALPSFLLDENSMNTNSTDIETSLSSVTGAPSPPS